MLSGIYLGKSRGLGDIGLVATNAEDSRIQLCRHHGSRVVVVLGLRPMAGLAGYALVHTLALHIQNIAVAGLAGLMTGVGEGQSCDFADGVGAVMSVTAEAVRHQKTPQRQKRDEPYQENCCHTEQVPRIFERLHSLSPQEMAISPGLGAHLPNDAAGGK